MRPLFGSVLASPSRRKTLLHITRLFSAQQFQSEIFVAILVLRLRNMNGLRKVCLSSTPPTVVPASNLNQGTNNIQVKVLGSENLRHQGRGRAKVSSSLHSVATRKWKALPNRK